MHQRKSKIILIYFFLLIIIASISNNNLNNLKFDQIKNIEIFGLDKKNKNILLNKIQNLKLGNIYSLNSNEIKKLIESNSLVERYKVFKKYPNKIEIKIQKTEFLAKINNNGKIFIIGSNGKLIPDNLEHNDLPFVFGKPNIIEFLKFKKVIDESKFSFQQIDDLYFFPSKRWDLKLKNNTILKLSNQFNLDTINNVYNFLEDYDGKQFNIVDARLENQIILNE
tara:strand:+ start:314 stop:985 length:672 start_codon:yes stop_codon:yes gene_type:complete